MAVTALSTLAPWITQHPRGTRALVYASSIAIAAAIQWFRPTSRELRLRRRGLNLALAGHPVEAEGYYRTSLALSRKLPKSQQARVLVCLADCLIAQERYSDARGYLDQALALGDDTGSGQGSMADLLIQQRVEAQKAIDMAEEALHFNILHAGNRYLGEKKNEYIHLRQVVCWSRKAEALLQLGRQPDAREEVERALRVIESAHIGGKEVGTGTQLVQMGAYWHAAMALHALGDKGRAVEYFRLARDLDPKGKYRILAQQRLAQLGYSS